jgi:hypothetical protein
MHQKLCAGQPIRFRGRGFLRSFTLLIQPLGHPDKKQPCDTSISSYIFLMSTAELRKLPALEKLKIIEMLWADLAEEGESFPSPAWHEEELRKTEIDFTAGRIEILGWPDARKELRKRFE